MTWIIPGKPSRLLLIGWKDWWFIIVSPAGSQCQTAWRGSLAPWTSRCSFAPGCCVCAHGSTLSWFSDDKKQLKARNILGVANSPTVLHLQASHWSPQHSSWNPWICHQQGFCQGSQKSVINKVHQKSLPSDGREVWQHIIPGNLVPLCLRHLVFFVSWNKAFEFSIFPTSQSKSLAT